MLCTLYIGNATLAVDGKLYYQFIISFDSETFFLKKILNVQRID